MKKILVLFMIGIMLLSLISCGNDGNTNDTVIDVTSGETADDVEAAEESSDASHSKVDAVESTSSETSTKETTEAVVESEKKSESYTDQQQFRTGQLTAGEWNDNKNYDFFMDVLNDNGWHHMKSYWQFNNWTRFEFQVINKKDRPLVNALIELHDGQGNVFYSGRTDNNGYAVLYPFLNKTFIQQPDVQARISYNQNIYEIVELNNRHDYFKVTLDELYMPVAEADIMFMIDTTGSMGDELSYLQMELIDVIKRVDNSQLDIRLSGNYYRDKYDDYLIHSHPFTNDFKEVVSIMNEEYANGGGDFEEAVVIALEDAINNHRWRDNAEAKLLFLVLDAPPHHNQQNLDQIHSLIKDANEKGIRIIPVASSGIDKETEFLLRFLDVTTNGTYVFLTDHSGIGNSHLTPTIGHYKVEQLNDLLVRVINNYLE